MHVVRGSLHPMLMLLLLWKTQVKLDCSSSFVTGWCHIFEKQIVNTCLDLLSSRICLRLEFKWYILYLLIWEPFQNKNRPPSKYHIPFILFFYSPTSLDLWYLHALAASVRIMSVSCRDLAFSSVNWSMQNTRALSLKAAAIICYIVLKNNGYIYRYIYI